MQMKLQLLKEYKKNEQVLLNISIGLKKPGFDLVADGMSHFTGWLFTGSCKCYQLSDDKMPSILRKTGNAVHRRIGACPPMA